MDHWKTTTFVGALGATGQTASMVLDGATNRAAFNLYLEEVLRPTLRFGGVVVMDNLPAHKRAKVRTALAAAGAQHMSLPPYSPIQFRSKWPSPSSKLRYDAPRLALLV